MNWIVTQVNRIFNSGKYFISKKSEPVYEYYKTITDFSVFSPKTQEPYDLNGRQIYLSSPSNDGLFICERLSQEEKDFYNADFLAHYSDWGKPKYEWVYKSMACNSYDKFRIDVYRAGRIAVKCNLPKYAWASPWLYLSQNKGDFNNPYLPVIDKTIPREFYFEIDLLETGMNPQSQLFTGHYGIQTNRKSKSSSIFWCDVTDMHVIEVMWDGCGNWTWLLDSVVVHEAFIPQPQDKIFPYFMFTLSMCDDYKNIQYPVKWKVDWIKFSDNLIYL